LENSPRSASPRAARALGKVGNQIWGIRASFVRGPTRRPTYKVMFRANCFASASFCFCSSQTERVWADHQSYTSSLVSAKPRSLLKLDQAYIAVGGREHFSLDRETDIMRAIALRISPREMQRCRLAHNLPTRCIGAEWHTICLIYLPLGLIGMRIA
jgi:acyl-coenzyme A synthetase/AMP-(fatty) acid ligase